MMKNRVIDAEVVLVPYYPNYDVTLSWYQDLDVCKQVDNIDHAYSLDTLKAMYTYLSTHVECYYIQYNSQSQKMFLSIGFQKVADEWYEYKISAKS